MGLQFTYGCMGSGKSAMLVMKEFNYHSRGYETIVLKPEKDSRDPGIIKPRPMKGLKVDILYRPDDDLFMLILDYAKRLNGKFVVFVDEVQFSTKEQIKQLWELTSCCGCDVFAYGLKINYLNNIFEPVIPLLVYSESIDEIEVGCKYCSNKATTHILYVDNKLVTSGDDEVIGDIEGRERFESVCQYCRENIIKKEMSRNAYK